MNQRIRQLAEQCRFEIQGINCEVLGQGFDEEKFAELIVADYAQQQVQAMLSNPAYARAMDEYYENKWSHRFD